MDIDMMIDEDWIKYRTIDIVSGKYWGDVKKQ